MNKRAKEKQLLEEAYSQVLEENWKKGTSKAPKGASFDSKKRYKPSRRDANSDGHGGRYTRTRPPGSGSTITHGEVGIKAEDGEGKEELTISGPIKIGDHVYKVGSNDPLGSGKISTIIEYSNGYMIFTRDEYGGLMSHMVNLKGQAVDDGYLKNEDGKSYSKEEAAEDEVYDHIDGLIDTEDKERLVYLFELAITPENLFKLLVVNDPKIKAVVTSIHDDLKKEGFDVDDINDYIAETFKFTLGG